MRPFWKKRSRPKKIRPSGHLAEAEFAGSRFVRQGNEDFLFLSSSPKAVASHPPAGEPRRNAPLFSFLSALPTGQLISAKEVRKAIAFRGNRCFIKYGEHLTLSRKHLRVLPTAKLQSFGLEKVLPSGQSCPAKEVRKAKPFEETSRDVCEANSTEDRLGDTRAF